ncbi:aldehyde dehydrogenase family protein [Fictibacillus barbaricus]|uniref:Aldehyde dehydrogenase family protein n=1 Tax=Fictibacillus barbaricus TaxID=182136 RepID=A0ABS2ZA21_9BACL|nr:aldehyde dehydrogenase family protein [Fictibacillus barbaricus]MBN3544164.1 aldehyde dehydrogenase family protein [Fictibacillus barbaricus]GGB69430.1 aldehyde dehydrogenase [Fictibacillus barbaricus]
MHTKHLWIDGKWVETQRYEPIISPFSGEKIAMIAQASVEDAEKAIVSAQNAFGQFKKVPAHKRSEILDKFVSLLYQRKEEAAKIIANEAAKPIKIARSEIDRTIQTYRFSAEEAKRMYGERIPMDAAVGGEERVGFTMRFPIGVISAITPFNFPFNLVAHKVGPAIAAGNTIVLKPAESTPLSGLFLGELFQEAGLPDGVLNIITGLGPELGPTLTAHPYVKKITFTGSPEVGKQIIGNAGFRKVTLELGSNSALIIDDGIDIEKIIKRIIEGAFSNVGQVCISIQRIYVHRSLYKKFLEFMIHQTRNLVTGSPLDENTEVTAVISKKSIDRIALWLAEAVELGANLEYGGTIEGQVMTPAILTNVPHQAKIIQQEVFGPVVSILPFDHLEEAVGLINDSRFGLQAGVYTNDVNHAFYCINHLETGGVLINDIPTFRLDHMPYGGIKDSGIGREGVKYAINEMTIEKFVSFHWNTL